MVVSGATVVTSGQGAQVEPSTVALTSLVFSSVVFIVVAKSTSVAVVVSLAVDVAALFS